jgi:hypothetical protein
MVIKFGGVAASQWDIVQRSITSTSTASLSTSTVPKRSQTAATRERSPYDCPYTFHGI